jgi:predicted GH43/DUF377 family glycosyl hydrolase
MLQILIMFLSILLIILLIAGCGNATSQSQTQSTTLSFIKEPSNAPVISSGLKGWPMFPTDPCVIKDNEGYHLFYTSLFCKKDGSHYYSWDAGNAFGCDLSEMIGTVGYAFSSDQGMTWEFRGSPVVQVAPEDWQSGDVETPFVLHHGDSLYLFYSALGMKDGSEFGNRYQIGAAILDLQGSSIRQMLSNEGTTFERLPEPVLPYNLTSMSFDNNTQEPSVIVKDGKLELFYIGIKLSKPDQPVDAPGNSITSVGLAKAVFDRDLNLISNSNGFILNGANITEVKYFNDKYHIFSIAQGDGEFHCKERINYYTSLDGITWSSPEILLTHGQGDDYDNWGIMAPTVIIDNNELVMFYTAWGIEDYPCFPEPFTSDIRFGMPFNNETQCIHGYVSRATAPRPETF